MKPLLFRHIENSLTISVNVLETSERIICFIFQELQMREVSFSDVGDYLVSQFATTDNYQLTFRFLHSMGYQ